MSAKWCFRPSVVLLAHPSVFDFLIPSLISVRKLPNSFPPHAATHKQRRHVSTANHASDGRSPPNQPLRIPKSGPEAAANPAPTSEPLTQAQREFLSSALRVNQAGELAATLIYTAQMPRLVRSHPNLRPLMKHMYAQEASHFSTFNALLARHRIRPTAMYPIWRLAATALGWGTALMGKEAAMACTEAVETEIGSHYNGQVKILLDMMEEMDKRGEDPGDELRDLVKKLRKIRDEELEHLDSAVENDAKEAGGHEILTNVIRSGCRGAIWVSERV